MFSKKDLTRFVYIALFWAHSILINPTAATDEVCMKDYIKCTRNSNVRYLLYDVNPPEGFNLRRDVYMRYAELAQKLYASKNPNLNGFKLVLPPWSHLIHWSNKNEPEHLPWSMFFDLDSLREFAPVVEIEEFFESLHTNKYTKALIDEVYILQHFPDMFENGIFEERATFQPCKKQSVPTYFNYPNLTSNDVRCLAFHGPAVNLLKELEKSVAKSILIDHAEVGLHYYFGSKTYWEARRSMRFNKNLRQYAAVFRKTYLNSTDETDKTFLPENWRDERYHRTAVGGPYLAVHMRRTDFLRGHSGDVPSIEIVGAQIILNLVKLGLKTVFLATDAPKKEVDALIHTLQPDITVARFIPTGIDEDRFHDGEIAIIDQIICSYARYFIGTHESTFTFRIQEEREILGFPTNTTFNILCQDPSKCDKQKPSAWTIVY